MRANPIRRGGSDMAEAVTKIPIRVSSADRRSSMRGAAHPVEQLRTEIDRLLSDFLRGYWHIPFRRSAVDVEPIWRGDISLGATPTVDIVDKEDAYKLTAELPGVNEKQVEEVREWHADDRRKKGRRTRGR